MDFVNDMDQVHMKWDNGRTLALVPSKDSFRKLTAQEITEENKTSPLSEKIAVHFGWCTVVNRQPFQNTTLAVLPQKESLFTDKLAIHTPHQTAHRQYKHNRQS